MLDGDIGELDFTNSHGEFEEDTPPSDTRVALQASAAGCSECSVHWSRQLSYGRDRGVLRYILEVQHEPVPSVVMTRSPA